MSFTNALFCENIGETASLSDVQCCYTTDQTTPTCRRNFNATSPTFTRACNNGDCLSECQKPHILYSSIIQDEPSIGTGQAPIERFRTCVNVPAISGFAREGALSDDTAAAVRGHVSFDAPDDAAGNVTNVVTECLTQTCQASRNPGRCSRPCAAVNMLVNATRPDLGGVNECLNKLCTGGYHSLPYADADVVGIGVFSSYILQCVLLMLLWLGLLCFPRSNGKKDSTASSTLSNNPHGEKPSKTSHNVKKSSRATLAASPPEPADKTPTTHESILETCLLQFHISQCYFSATIQIASLAYGIFTSNILLTFLLIPLALNGILPIVFGLLLLHRRGKSSLDITLLSLACWLLSSIVYWVLYSNLIEINSKFPSKARRYLAYQQFSYKLSALDSCGGYSALAVCPQGFRAGRESVVDAGWRLSYVTPLIWAYSTAILVLILVSMVRTWLEERKRKGDEYGGQAETYNVHLRPRAQQQEVATLHLLEDAESAPGRRPAGGTDARQPASRRRSRFMVYLHRVYRSRTFHVLTTGLFLLALGIQLSLLSISTSLKMMSRRDWGFGQIIAVAVWVPPLLQYVYEELGLAVKKHGWWRRVRSYDAKSGRGKGERKGFEGNPGEVDTGEEGRD